MNDVEKGGATVFPYIKVRLTTRKGSAAFWHNLHQSGYGGKLNDFDCQSKCQINSLKTI